MKQNPLTQLLLLLIRVYQKTLSPDHSWTRVFFPAGVCRFEPTCSEYAHEAISRYGVGGVFLAGKRIVRCHPGAVGGSDPVPTVYK